MAQFRGFILSDLDIEYFPHRFLSLLLKPIKQKRMDDC